MKMTYVSSSNIESIGFEADTNTLTVEFIKGGTYEYSGVPEHLYDELMSADSKGTFFAANIKGSYGYTRV